MQRLASSTFSMVTNAKPRDSFVRGSITTRQSLTFPSLLKNFSRSVSCVRVDSPVTYRLFPGFLTSSLSLLLERLLFLDLDLDLDLPRLFGGGDLETLRLLGGGDLEMVRTPLGGKGGGGGRGGDLEAARLLGGGDLEPLSLSAGGVIERAVYLTSLECDMSLLSPG